MCIILLAIMVLDLCIHKYMCLTKHITAHTNLCKQQSRRQDAYKSSECQSEYYMVVHNTGLHTLCSIIVLVVSIEDYVYILRITCMVICLYNRFKGMRSFHLPLLNLNCTVHQTMTIFAVSYSATMIPSLCSRPLRNQISQLIPHPMAFPYPSLSGLIRPMFPECHDAVGVKMNESMGNE